MFTRIRRCLLACLIVSTAGAPAARAQWAVIDVQAIGQLMQEVQTLQAQLQVARAQLLQAKQALQSTTGPRGMDQLLGGITRNYLPTDWSQLASALQGSGGYSTLASEVRGTISANAVLSPSQLSALSPADQQQIGAARQAAALRQAIAQEALANASGRFAAIQSLIAAISTASDQKAILDLQSRISVELGMLQNEQIKLHVLAQAALALDSANTQREREQALSDQGRFESRFQPTP